MSYEGDAPGEAQPWPEAGEAHPAEMSEKPADFANASPFPDREKEKDTLGTAVFAAAALAILAFFVSMLGLLQMQAPK